MINFFLNYSGTELLIISIAFIIAIVFALTIHEFSHSYIACTQGDYTSVGYGRLTLNPLKHIDPIGFLCLLLFGFGWAKPVPINSKKFRNYRQGLFLTSIAGVVANLIFCFLFVGLLVIFFSNPETLENSNYFVQFIYYLLFYSAYINLGLAVFNLLPIPPLDGFNMLCSFTKGTNRVVNSLARYGYVILFALLIFDVIDILFAFVYSFVLPAFMSFWYCII